MAMKEMLAMKNMELADLLTASLVCLREVNRLLLKARHVEEAARMPKKEEAEKRWCAVCLTGPSPFWERAEKGSDVCMRHRLEGGS